MKPLLYIITILFFIISCQSQEEQTNQVEAEKPINPLNGTWAMTQYFDTILANKSIAKYRQSCFWKKKIGRTMFRWCRIRKSSCLRCKKLDYSLSRRLILI